MSRCQTTTLLVVAEAEVSKLEKELDPELELDPQHGLQLPGAELKPEAELELTPELTEVADVESQPPLALELKPGP